jgi:tRNA A-37 threonylcarbamoyl transferase component Bud32
VEESLNDGNNMASSKFCKQCHKPVPEAAPEGLCPECLAKVAVGSEPRTGGQRTPPDPAVLAQQFPQLEIIELIGMGGMGVVYKARQPKLDRLVALKVLPIESAQDASFAERFEREAKALAKLNHPGIVTIYDFGQTADFYYFVMEYVDGMNLRQWMQTERISPRNALALVTHICSALQYAHDENIVHRDIKPENILINKKGQAKIADFGLVKLLGHEPDSNLTATQTVMGTTNYMAPEQREQPLEVDHRADIYSLGVVFYEMLTGEVPMGRFDPPSKKVHVDVRLDEVVLHALEREPARRYQKASEIRTGVETIAATMEPSDGHGRPGDPSAQTQPGTKQRTFNRIGVSAAAVVVVVAAFLAVGMVIRDRKMKAAAMEAAAAALQHAAAPPDPAHPGNGVKAIEATDDAARKNSPARIIEPARAVTLKFVSVDSEETSGQNGYGENAVDGNPDTYWHTQWQDGSPGLPHEIIIELIPTSTIKGFTYLPRQDESDHGTIKDYEFYVSDDGQEFGHPVKKGAFKPDKEKKTETFWPIKCRFIKLRAISEINGLAWTSAAEIGVVPSGEDAPGKNVR